MNKVGVSVLWCCLAAFMACTALLAASAVLRQLSSGTVEGGHILSIGAFTASWTSADDDEYIADIKDNSCDIEFEAFQVELFPESGEAAACSAFRAFRALLVTAAVLHFVVAQALYTSLLKGWLTPSVATESRWLCLTLGGGAAVAVATTATSFGLLVAQDFAFQLEWGLSFRMIVVALALSVCATVVLVADCYYCSHQCSRSAQPVAPFQLDLIKLDEVSIKNVMMNSSTGKSDDW